MYAHMNVHMYACTIHDINAHTHKHIEFNDEQWICSFEIRHFIKTSKYS